MSRTRIKLCGMRSAEDALAAAELGADAIGMVFAPQARRCISMDVAAEILRRLPAFVTPVGLFMDQPADEVIRISSQLDLRHLQLHGEETAEQVAELAPRIVLKAVRFSGTEVLGEWKSSPANLRALLLESAGASGGSGVENNWDAIASAKASGAFAALPPVILAGGLTPENVKDVVMMVRPFAVDVSSGIEAEWGKKSIEKMRAFVGAVREADALT